jgi:hypothetical protein
MLTNFQAFQRTFRFPSRNQAGRQMLAAVSASCLLLPTYGCVALVKVTLATLNTCVLTDRRINLPLTRTLPKYVPLGLYRMRLGCGVLSQSTSALGLRSLGDGNVVFIAEKTYHLQIEYRLKQFSYK